MKIKTFANYSIRGGFKAYLIFFGVIFLILHACVALNLFAGSGSMGGMDFATIIFLFVCGCSYYKEDISMGIQNGVSRKTYYLSIGIVFVILAIIASAGDIIISLLGNAYENILDGFIYSSVYEQTFIMHGDLERVASPSFGEYIEMFFMQTADNIMALTSGLCISSFAYILPKTLKFIIPAAIYAILFIVGPVVDLTLIDGTITSTIFEIYSWMMKSSWNISLISLLAAVVFYAVSFLFIRRVNIVDRK